MRRDRWPCLAGAARLAAFVLAAVAGPASGATLSGVSMPDMLEAGGAHVVLNGLALRTYSFLRLHIYVAGLYLEHPNSDADAIMASDQVKLLRFDFVRDVGADAARRSWRESLANNCTEPCHLAEGAVAQFLAKIPAVHAGDISSFLFMPGRLTIEMNGQALGSITDAAFSRVVLASFIGEHATVPEVRQALLKK